MCVIVVLGKHCDDKRKGGAIDATFQKSYMNSMNDFTQDFIAVTWKELGLKNFVFSPFSMHSLLTMLASAATDLSSTQSELLDGFGRANVIETLEHVYGKVVKNYKGTSVEKTIKFGNQLWTTPRYFSKIDEGYKCKIEQLYGSEFSKLVAKNPEKEVNDWVKEVTQGKTDKIIGKFSYLNSNLK